MKPLTVAQSILKLQLLNPEMDLLVESDDGLPFGSYDIIQSTWTNDDGTITPVALVQINN